MAAGGSLDVAGTSSPGRESWNNRSPLFKPLKTFLSDAGVYAYCALCAISLHDLFPEDWNRTFRERYLSRLIKRVDLPSQVEPVMFAFLGGEGGDTEPLISLLKEEPALNGNCLLIIEDLIVFAVEEGVYDARTRVFILHAAWLLRVALPLVEIYEESVVEMLSQEVQEISEDEQKEQARRKRNKKLKRYLLIGVATLGGGAVLGLTGGLAAPFMAAGAGAIIGGAGAAVLGSATGIAVIGSLFGVAGAGLTGTEFFRKGIFKLPVRWGKCVPRNWGFCRNIDQGYKMQKRVGDIEEFAFDTLTEGHQLHVTLAVSGWLSDDGPEAFQEPWLTLMHSREQYCLRYESAYFLQLGRAMDYLFSFAVSMAAQEALKYTILSGLISAIIWPATLITVAGVIDNPWGVCIRRSAEVGKHLANVLIERQQGKRPITLIGFSLGARVIFYCLQEMAKRKGCEGIVEDAIFLGAPVSANLQSWQQFARVVNGRIVNGYCRGDWLLKFLYRTSSGTMKIAGLQAIKWGNRRMCNVDLSDVVCGHMDYANKMDTILKAIGVRTCDEVADADSHLRKSRSDNPVTGARRASGASRQLKQKSKSDGELRFSFDLNTLNVMERDRSQSLESVLSKSSVSSTTMMNPTGLNTPEPSISPLFFQRKSISPDVDSFSQKSGINSSTDLTIPDSWEWDAWEDNK